MSHGRLPSCRSLAHTIVSFVLGLARHQVMRPCQPFTYLTAQVSAPFSSSAMSLTTRKLGGKLHYVLDEM